MAHPPDYRVIRLGDNVFDCHTHIRKRFEHVVVDLQKLPRSFHLVAFQVRYAIGRHQLGNHLRPALIPHFLKPSSSKNTRLVAHSNARFSRMRVECRD